MFACRRWNNACSLVLKAGLAENGLTCVIHDLIDGPCTGRMNVNDAVCNLKRVTHVATGPIAVIAMNALCSMISEYERNNAAKKITRRTARPG